MGAITLRQLVSGAERRLSPSLGQGEARAMVGIIMESLKGYRPVDVVMHAGDEVTPWLESQVDGIIGRVLDGEPLQYVLGVARFMGNDYAVTPDTLIPRPETAEMVDMVAGRNGGRTDLRVLDIGTGSGCIAISLARVLKFAQIDAVDISKAALEVAAENARRLKAGVRFIEMDILSQTPPSAPVYDIIVSNPPYIALGEEPSMDRRVVDHEPHRALFVPDSDPLVFYRAIAGYAAGALVPGGQLYVELNPLFASGVAGLFSAAGFAGVELHRDYCGRVRFATAVKEGGGQWR